MNNPAKIIKIVSPTKGDAPEWVKEAWIGCIMPCVELSELPPVYKDDEEKIRGGYFVRQDIALTELRKRLRAAALWYATAGHPKPGKYFHFPLNDVIVIGISLPNQKPREL